MQAGIFRRARRERVRCTVAIYYLEGPGLPGQRLSHGSAELEATRRSEFCKQIGLGRKAAAEQPRRKRAKA